MIMGERVSVDMANLPFFKVLGFLISQPALTPDVTSIIIDRMNFNHHENPASDPVETKLPEIDDFPIFPNHLWLRFFLLL